jgi:hypothetical protein
MGPNRLDTNEMGGNQVTVPANYRSYIYIPSQMSKKRLRERYAPTLTIALLAVALVLRGPTTPERHRTGRRGPPEGGSTSYAKTPGDHSGMLSASDQAEKSCDAFFYSAARKKLDKSRKFAEWFRVVNSRACPALYWALPGRFLPGNSLLQKHSFCPRSRGVLGWRFDWPSHLVDNRVVITHPTTLGAHYMLCKRRRVGAAYQLKDLHATEA